MLLTDSDILTISDLTAIDPESTQVASSEKPLIVMEGPNSIIRNTVMDAGNELLAKFQNFSGYLVSPGVSLNHVAAVMNIMSTSISRPRMRLNQVVAIGPNPSKIGLKHWLLYYALRNLYRAAFARFARNEDRYQKKMEFWEEERQVAWKRLVAQGIPIVLQPLPCPGALREFGAGVFDASALSAGGSGSADPGNTWNVAITWVGQGYVSQASKGNSESAGSAEAQIVTTAGQLLTVSMLNLSPPGGTLPPVGTADNIYSQITATGWNIYAGTEPGKLFLQTPSPLPIAQISYTLPAAPLTSGPMLQPGQFEDYNFAFQNVLHRA